MTPGRIMQVLLHVLLIVWGGVSVLQSFARVDVNLFAGGGTILVIGLLLLVAGTRK